jgi:hypothetical protein
MDDDEPTQLPPIPLPETEGITFLATVGEVKAEGKRMGHCIAGYAREAQLGRCFLFHIDYKGEMASAEVSPSGRLMQCHGVRNRDNKAVDWGTKQLNRWLQNWPKDANKTDYSHPNCGCEEFDPFAGAGLHAA